MKTIPLCELVRSPRKVKRWTSAGLSVQVNENGGPLWVIEPATNLCKERARQQAVEAELQDLLRQPESKLSLSRLIKQARQ